MLNNNKRITNLSPPIVRFEPTLICVDFSCLFGIDGTEMCASDKKVGLD